MSTNRWILDLLGRETLVRLMRERDLAPTRENDERRKALAHSYHGDVEALILALTRQELVHIFKVFTFDVSGVESRLSNPGKYRLDELQAFAMRAFAGRRVRIPAGFTPVSCEDDDAVDDEDAEAEDEDSEADDNDDDPSEAEDDDVSVAEALGIASSTWSRPRQVSRILDALGHEPVQRLRRGRFQDLIVELLAGGVEACLADDPSSPCTPDDDSPGIEAKLRLRLIDADQESEPPARDERGRDDDVDRVAAILRNAAAPMRARDIARMLGLPRARVNAALYENVGSHFVKNDDFTWSVPGRGVSKATRAEGGPRIVVQSGEKPIPVQAARPSDYNLAVLRLQFLTAVPSVERRSLPAWPDGYLTAATRGLSLPLHEMSLLRAYAAGLCIGNHSPYDAIPRLTPVLTSTEWETLLDDFQALNPFQPELVRAIVEQVEPVIAPRSSAGVWRRAEAPPAPDLAPAPEEPSLQPKAAASTRPRSPEPTLPEVGANQRDLGALAGMFDEE